MRQILFYIHADSLFSFAPIEGVAAVGFVVPILMWVAYTLGFGWWQSRSPGGGGLRGPLISAAVGAAVLSCVPAVFGARLAPGIPVYGYGLMVFLGFITGGLWAARRARSVGIDPEVIWDLLTWFFVAGIGGARLFFLVQYSDKVYSPGMSLGGRVFATFNLSNGGLVLFGGVIAVVAAMLIFCRVRKVSLLLIGDVIVPSFFVGLAFGRIGCLLNGCCYGGPCDLPWAVTFPPDSPPFMDQLLHGRLHGVQFLEDEKQAAGFSLLVDGERERVASINGVPVASVHDASAPIATAYAAGDPLVTRLENGETETAPAATPGRSLPVHPTQ
ncbi:MAG: prolipoprotein diacylglyceryl transferase family protein, partial [Planctomycetota bacterium]